MIYSIKKTILFLAFTWATICPVNSFAWHDYVSNGDWDYNGSGRDHPYSAYIDRRNYVGPADYTLFKADYIDEDQLKLSVINPPPAVPQDQFIVNIPNKNGGYTPIVIKRTGSGYTGPQGEYYPDFPKVFQLEIIYGK